MTNATPVAILADSITTFSKSALKQLKELEKQLSQANAEIRDAQTERDNAIKQTRASQTELEAQKQDVVRYKSSLVQAEHTIENQAEVINQLHREVARWKEQARNWHDHFTRVEEERCSLATRLDEMLSEQSRAFGPIIPAHLFSNIDSSISAPVMKQSSTAVIPSTNRRTMKQLLHFNSVPENPPVRKHKIADARKKAKPEQISKSTSGTNSGQNDDPALYPPMSRLVRRVQAVIRVKSEENGGVEPTSSDNDSSIVDGNYEPPRNTNPKRSAVVKKTKQTMRGGNDDDDDVPNADTPQRAPLPGNTNRGFESDGDDELILGGGVPAQARHTTHPDTDPPTKKRRLNQTRRQNPTKKV